MDTVEQYEDPGDAAYGDWGECIPADGRNARTLTTNEARLRVASQLNISPNDGSRYVSFCDAWHEAIRRQTLASGEVTTPYPEADIVKGIMDDAVRMQGLRETLTPVTTRAVVQEVRRRSIVQELCRDYLPDVDPIAAERAMDEAESRIENWQTGAPTLITMSMVVDIIREQAVPGSLVANLRRVRNVGRVLVDETQDVPQEVDENRTTALQEILDRHPNAGVGTTMQYDGEGVLTRAYPTFSPPKELNEQLSEALIDLVGSTSEKDLAKNADLSPERVKEIMHLVSCAIGMRRTNR